MGFDERLHPLSYAVRLPVVFKYVGQLCLAVAGLTLVPCIVSIFEQNIILSWRYLFVICVLIVFGAPLSRLQTTSRLQSNEALLISALIFLITSVLMAYPMMSSGLSFIDALFETVSGVTTTGLTMLSDVEVLPPSLQFARAWLQWYGGLGIVVLSVALIISPGTVAKRLAKTEVESVDLISGTRMHARRSVSVYLVLTATCAVILWLLGVPVFLAIIHALTGVSTGGFSTYNNSIAGLGEWPVQFTLLLFALAGAVAFPFLYSIFSRSLRSGLGHTEFFGLLAACLITTLFLAMFLTLQSRWLSADIFYYASILALSAQTATGFTNVPITELDQASRLVLMLSMFIGGSTSSTAGGIKILRLLILLRMLQLLIMRTRLPDHAVVQTRLDGQQLGHDELEHSLLIILLFAIVIILSWLPFVAMGYDPMNALFDVVSATATGGLTTGITNAQLAPSLKLVLCFDMLIGRLEVVAMLIVLYPGTWLGKRNPT